MSSSGAKKRPQCTDFLPKKLPAQTRSRATFEAIQDATIRVLVNEGYAAVSTNRVAEVAGVSIGTLYEYFPHKKGLIATALSREIDRLTQDLVADLRRALRTDRRSEDSLRPLVQALADSLEARRKLLRVAFHQVPFFWEIPKARQHTRRLLRITRRVLAHDGFGNTHQDLDERAWVLVSMIWFVLVQNAIHRPSHLSRERVIDNINEMLFRLVQDGPDARA